MKINSDKLYSACMDAMERHCVPGLTACVIQNGEIAAGLALGTKDGKAAPVDGTTLFEAASLTKPLFAVYFLLLAQRGIVSLDEPAAEQGAPIWSRDRDYARITPRHCLCHGSGLPDWAAVPMELLFSPGSGYSYSGQGYYLLQKLAERIAGTDFAAAVREEILAPCGMETTVLYNSEVGQRMSCGFDGSGRIIKRRTAVDLEGNAPEPNAAWSLYANAGLYARFICRFMKDGSGLSDEYRGLMTTPANHAAPDVDWGLGWGISRGLMWHWGDNTGFKSFAVWDPADNNGIVIFTNSDSGKCAYMEILASVTDIDCLASINSFIDGAE